MNILDAIRKEVPDEKLDYEVKISKSAINTLKRTAMLRGAQLLMEKIHRGKMIFMRGGDEHIIVRVAPLEEFMGEKNAGK